ncbi:MAG: sulfotransferase [Myxococcales bacterium]|nr:sulfotransferase [Myxococcales bacterium]
MSAEAGRRSRSTSTEYRRPFRPWPIALVNRVIPTALVRWTLPLDVDPLLERARRATGLHDFGSDSFVDPLRRLLASIADEAQLSALGHLMQRERIGSILENRLRVEACFRDDPTIAETPLPPILVIAGLQRTGTTLLHRLLASVPETRALRSFEALAPAPIAPHRAGAIDPRIIAARRAERALHYLAPDFFAIHPIGAEEPEEDVLLLDHSFMSQVAEATLFVPRFSAHLETIDVTPAYRYMRRLLQLLQRQRPGQRIVLKTPNHLEHLAVLLDVFPEAKIVQTHRDPQKTVGSFCSMVAHAIGVFSDRVDPLAIGRHWLRKITRMVSRADEARSARGFGFAPIWSDAGARRDALGGRDPDSDDPHGAATRVVDLSYDALLADPVGCVEALLSWFGDTPSPSVRRALEAALGENRQHKFGRHRYSLEPFGLSRAAIEAALGAYRERYAIPIEAR